MNTLGLIAQVEGGGSTASRICNGLFFGWGAVIAYGAFVAGTGGAGLVVGLEWGAIGAVVCDQVE